MKYFPLLFSLYVISAKNFNITDFKFSISYKKNADKGTFTDDVNPFLAFFTLYPSPSFLTRLSSAGLWPLKLNPFDECREETLGAPALIVP